MKFTLDPSDCDRTDDAPCPFFTIDDRAHCTGTKGECLNPVLGTQFIRNSKRSRECKKYVGFELTMQA